MMKKIISIFLLAVVTSFTFSSCEDMLTGEMDRNVEADELASDTLYAYWGILRGLQDIAERYVILGECRGDLVDGIPQFLQDSIKAILEFDQNAVDGSDAYHQIRDYYKIINSCNTYLAKCDLGHVNAQGQNLMMKEYAQIASIRAWVYMQLVLTYGRVPYFEQPLLSTAAMSDFRSAPAYVDANTLASSGVVQLLEQYRSVQAPYSEANSGKYGANNSSGIYASNCIFPQNLVLADIYLLGGLYADAAQHYYDYLNTDKGGALDQDYGITHADNNYCTYAILGKSQGTNKYVAIPPFTNVKYSYIDMFWSGMHPVDDMDEVVTIIPSSTTRLYGRVLRDINRLFGFDATLIAGTSELKEVDEDGKEKESYADYSAVYLQLNFEHQLGFSQAYEKLCKDQDYETYIGPDAQTPDCTVQDKAGDARFYEVTHDYLDTKTGAIDPVKFVMKQNPDGIFNKYYPIIYRKGNIWLRFAAALNGAGFPGYAFAILRHGLCGNPDWLPTEEANYPVATKSYTHLGKSVTLPCRIYWDDTETVGDVKKTYDNAIKFLYHLYIRGGAEGETFSMAPANYDEFFTDLEKYYNEAEEDYPTEHAFFTELVIYSNTLEAAEEVHNEPTQFEEKINEVTSAVVCNYITKSEMLKAQTVPWLSFTTRYLQGSSRSIKGNTFYWGPTEYSATNAATWYASVSYHSLGIHARGCGILKQYEESKIAGVGKGTTYNFVNQINKMLKKYEDEKTDLKEDDIYNWGKNASVQNKVQLAIADLILEEMALETCFEGNRFFDLLCYSRILNSLGKSGTDRVAKIIASRNGTGTPDPGLYSKLQDQNNWYLPCP